MFLFNQGDKQGAAAKLLNFRKYFEVVLGKRRDVDPEVNEEKHILFAKLNKFFTNRSPF